ncbi:hypothetical protein QJQ45_023965 [Haematococcus lacustris]|nr:hypothetical protein QJQ45_023965 [Haematococcus lacustris]
MCIKTVLDSQPACIKLCEATEEKATLAMAKPNCVSNMATEANLSRSLDDIIEANRAKLGRKTGPRRGTVTVERGAGVMKAMQGVENQASGSREARPGARPKLGVANGGVRKPRRAAVAPPPEQVDDGEYGMGGGGGRVRKGPRVRDTPPGNPDAQWKHDLFKEVADDRPPRRMRQAGAAAGAKLLVSNLDYLVNEQDIKELFQTCGAVVSVVIKYDRSGRSEGEAEVTFARQQDAQAAMQEYSGVALDGKLMHIELCAGGNVIQQLSSGRVLTRPGEGAAVERPAPVPGQRAFQHSLKAATGGMGRSEGGPRQRGGGAAYGTGGRGGRGGGRLRSAAVARSREELDADLDSMKE